MLTPTKEDKNMDKIILNTDPEAARFVENISGWVSRGGFFYGADEKIARFEGCTHIKCQRCGSPTEKRYILCNICREKRAAEKYAKRERIEWDEKGMLYSEVMDRFFSSWDGVKEYAETEERSLEDLRLLICEPVYLREISIDYFIDELPDEGELPDEVYDAMEKFNTVLRAAGPVSWELGSKVPILPVA